MKTKFSYISWTAFLSLVLICFAWSVPANADTQGHFFDTAGLVNSQAATNLDTELAAVSNSSGCEVYIYTTAGNGKDVDTTKSAEEIADYLLDATSCDSGVLLYINTGTRDWAFSTKGNGAAWIDYQGREFIMDQVLDDLSKNKYEKAFTTFTKFVAKYLEHGAQGDPYLDGRHPHPGVSIYMIGCDLIVAAGIGYGFARSRRSKLTSVQMETGAGSYLKEGSFVITGRRDNFMGKHVTQTVVKSSKSTNTSGGAGSTSSSGKF